MKTARRIPAVLCKVICSVFLAATAAFGAEKMATKLIVAGPFSVTAPEGWAERVIVEKVPIHPLYSPEDVKARARENGLEGNSVADSKAGKTPPAKAVDSAPKPLLPVPEIAPKPSPANRPEHWAIRFPKLATDEAAYDPKEARDDSTAPQILIHKSAEWGKALLDGTQTAADTQKTIQDLRRALKRQDVTGSPVFMSGVIAQKKKLNFTGGHGFRVLAQYNMESDLLRKGRLHYLFVGMSDDDTCQIVATIPLDLPGLPADDDSAAEHLGFSTRRYAELSKGFDKYERLAEAWLGKNLVKAQPSVEELDAMMQSLVAKKWE